MKKIQIYGIGCTKCNQLIENAEKAIQELGIDYTIEKITDLAEITAAGIMMTPGFAIDGAVKKSGKILNVDEIKTMLNKEC